MFARMPRAILPTRLDAWALRLTKACEGWTEGAQCPPYGSGRGRKPSSNFEQQLLQDRLFEIIEAD